MTNEIEPDHVDWSYDGALVEVDSGANWIELDFNAAPTGSYPIYGQAFNSDGIGGEPQGIGVYWDGREVGFESPQRDDS